MNQTFSTFEIYWQGVDEEPTAGSNNLVKSGGVKSFVNSFVEEHNSFEYKKVTVDSDGYIVDYISENNIEGHYLEQKCHKGLSVGGTVTAEDANIKNLLYKEDNKEYVEATLDSNNKVVECKTSDGTSIHFLPTVFEKDVKFKGNVSLDKNVVFNSPFFSFDKISLKYVSPCKNLFSPVGSSHINNRTYTNYYVEEVYDLFKKCGLSSIRDYPGNIEPALKENLSPIGLAEEFPTNPKNMEVSDVVYEFEQKILAFDGNPHVYNGKNVKAKIDDWVLFNEPDLNWTDVEDYFAKVAACFVRMKEIRPECRLILGGFASLTNGFLDDLFQIRDDSNKAIWDYCDIFAFHKYGESLDALNDLLDSYKNFCNNTYRQDEYSHLKDKPVWVLECNTIPLTLSNKEEYRHKYLPKMLLTLLSFGIEKVLIYKLVEYNAFVVTSRDNYYGLISPNYEYLAYAGFFFNDVQETSITPDGLLDKTYIFPPNYIGQYSKKNPDDPEVGDIILNSIPYMTLDQIDGTKVMDDGIIIKGNGFTVKGVYITKWFNNDRMCFVKEGEWSHSHSGYERVRKIWSGEQVITDLSYITIDGSLFAQEDFYPRSGYYLAVEVDEESLPSDISIDSFEFKDSYYSLKALASLFNGECSVPEILHFSNSVGEYTVARWKKAEGYYNYALWGNINNIEIEVSKNASFYDVKGNLLLSKPSFIDDSVIYVENSEFLKIN